MGLQYIVGICDNSLYYDNIRLMVCEPYAIMIFKLHVYLLLLM